MLAEQGFVVVASAGNSSKNACESDCLNSNSALTVGATYWNDIRRASSNWGDCVDIWAVGTAIQAANDSGGISSFNGTSFSTPFVSGAAALYLSLYPTATPHQVGAALLAASTQGVVSQSGNALSNMLYADVLHATPPFWRDKGEVSAALSNSDQQPHHACQQGQQWLQRLSQTQARLWCCE